MNQLEVKIRINQLKCEIKNLEFRMSKVNKKIKANQDILDEALSSKRKFQQNISELLSKLNNRLNQIEGAFPIYYRREHEKIMKKGDLDDAIEELSQTIYKAKDTINELENELLSIKKVITTKKRELRQYQNVLLELERNNNE